MFERKPPTSIKPEATPGERIDFRKSGQLEVPETQDEKAETIIDKTSLKFSKQTDDDCPGQSNLTLCLIKIQRFTLNIAATWKEMQFQKSRIVCDAVVC